MMALLDGDWKLVYTSNSELLAILALSKLPFVTIGDITQRVDTITATVENRAALSVPLSRTSLSATASFEVRSPKRLQIAFERGSIATPELLSDLEVPESVDVLGQTVDLSQLRGVLQPFSQGLSSILKQVRSQGFVCTHKGTRAECTLCIGQQAPAVHALLNKAALLRTPGICRTSAGKHRSRHAFCWLRLRQSATQFVAKLMHV